MSRQDERESKIGAGHASAMMRQGLSELRGVFFNESNVAQPTQYGIYGHVTPGEVAKEREQTDLAQSPDQEPQQKTESLLDHHVERAEVQVSEQSKGRETMRANRVPERSGPERG
ncbi:MAG: hypothetical protein AB7Q00_12630 [Phycisphaerales bacterium]